MARPSNEAKKAAAEAQVAALRKEGHTTETIRAKLAEVGLTVKQLDAVCPLPVTAKTATTQETAKATPERVLQVMTECAEFLDYAHRKLQTVKPEHAGIRQDLAVWSRRLKGAL